MASISAPSSSNYNVKPLSRIVGIACLAGFVVDMLLLALPPNLGSVEWRIGFVQQMSDRSIVLLFGVALLIYSNLDLRALRKQLAMLCLVLGVVFLLSCILVVRDSLTLNDITVKNINNQVSQIQTQIENSKTNPNPAQNVTPEQLQQASDLITKQAGTAKEGAKTNLLKAALRMVGNLVVVGIALISLGRYGIRPRKG